MFLKYCLFSSFILGLCSIKTLADVQSSCTQDIQRFCSPVQGVEQDYIFCLKRNSNLLSPTCFNYVRQYLEIHFTPTPRPTAVPTVVVTPTPTPTPIPAPPKLVRDYINQERYQDCINRWPRMRRGYFVLDKEESCTQYAKVYPTEAINRCVTEALGAQPYSRDYFLNYQAMAEQCEAHPEMEASQRACVLQKVQNGGDALGAFNECDPKIKACIAQMEKDRPSYGQKIYKDLYFNFCFSYFDQPEMGKCVSAYAHKYTELAERPRTLQAVCHPSVRSCADKLFKKLPKKHKAEKIDDIGYTCKMMFDDDLSEDWAECTFENYLTLSSDLRQMGALCKVSNVSARQCVIQYMKDKLSYDDATKVCRVQVTKIRECLFSYFKARAPFDTSPLKGVPYHIADKFCALEVEDERQCFINALKTEHRQTEEVIGNISKTCHEQSSIYQQCISDYNDYFDHNYTLNVSKEEGRKICAIPSREMRLCMLNSIMRREYVRPRSIFSNGNTWFPYDKYYEICLGEFLGRLLKDMAPGREWPCRYQYFEQMSVWDKGWHCAYSTEKPCDGYKQQINSMTDDEIKPHCSQFNPNYHNAERCYGNPLWDQCRKRKLIK